MLAVQELRKLGSAHKFRRLACYPFQQADTNSIAKALSSKLFLDVFKALLAPFVCLERDRMPMQSPSSLIDTLSGLLRGLLYVSKGLSSGLLWILIDQPSEPP